MKQIFALIVLLTLSNYTFSQESDIKSKLKEIQLNAIEKGKLVNYDTESQFKNKVVIIEFWETWCIPCIEGMQHLKKLKDEFSDDLKIICISSDDLDKAHTFIDKNNFQFDFIFDKEKIMQKKFPHSSIPYTIVVDKKGKIQASTHPGYIDHAHINKLLSGKDIDVPNIKNVEFTGTQDENMETPLVSFKLFNYELGQTAKSSSSTIKNKKRIVTGYTANAFMDTVETITEYTASGKNIVQLYQLAYGDLHETRFLYDSNLKYIKSLNPNHRYNIIYKISDIFGDFNTTLLHQLNATLGMETFKTTVDTNVLVLKKMEVNGNSIKMANISTGKWLNTNVSADNSFEVSGNKIDVNTLVKLIAEKTNLLVDSDINGDLSYELKIAMDKSGLNINEWITYFQSEGIYLTKEKRGIEMIKIKKQPIKF